jgi:hypothetical protein
MVFRSGACAQFKTGRRSSAASSDPFIGDLLMSKPPVSATLSTVLWFRFVISPQRSGQAASGAAAPAQYGAPLSLRLSDGGTPASQFPHQIPPNGALHLITDGSPSDVKTGWAQLVPAVGSTPVGAGVFGLTQNGILVTESGIPAVASATEARIYIDTSNGHDTGLARADTSSETETGTFTAFGTDGVTPGVASSGTISLAVNGHDAKFVEQLILGRLAQSFTGVLVISSSSPFAVLTLRSLINSSSTDNSSKVGLNAAVLANTGGKITITGDSVTSSGSGANGHFATGSGSSITMSNGTIKATGANAHGVDVTYGGTITLTNVNVTTSRASSSALATDFGGGTVKVTGGTIIAEATSTITATLQNQTTLTGIAQRVAMTIDSTSVWNVTGNSVLTSLTDPSGISGLSITNITGNGYDVYYVASLAASQSLGGLTYSLVNGGKLIPK